jgi:hypothetical protein
MRDKDSHLIWEAADKIPAAVWDIIDQYLKVGGARLAGILPQIIKKHQLTEYELRMVISTISHMPDQVFMETPGLATDKKTLLHILRIFSNQ